MKKGALVYLLLIAVFLLGQQVALTHPLTHLGQLETGSTDPLKQPTLLDHCDKCAGCQQLQAIASSHASVWVLPFAENYGASFSAHAFAYPHSSLYFARAPPTVIT
jgi:hypothetical protein